MAPSLAQNFELGSCS